MGTVYSALGARLDGVEMLDGQMQGADRDLVKIWQKMNARRFHNIPQVRPIIVHECMAEHVNLLESWIGKLAKRPASAVELRQDCYR